MMNELPIDRSKKARTVGVIFLPVVWALGLFVFMNTTSPLQNGPVSVLVVFSLTYLLLVSACYVAALLFVQLGRFFGWGAKKVDRRQLYYLVSVLSLGPVFILALNTLGQLEVKEVLLVIILLGLGSFYVFRRGKNAAF